jgi:hypothetical protein
LNKAEKEEVIEMTLAKKIETIEGFKELSLTTRDAALKEIIERYKSETIREKEVMVKIEPCVDGAVPERKYNPAIKDVISGNTTFMAEYNKLGPLEFILQGNGGVADCTFDMGQQIVLVDRTIQRLYAKPLPPISAADDY